MITSTPFIPSIAYKAGIESACIPLNNIGKIRYFVLYIIFNDGTQFVLSSTPEKFLSLYWYEQFNNYDFSAKIQSFNGLDYYLCDENLGADKIFKETIEEKFNMHRTFYVTRNASECRLVFGALHEQHIDNPQQLYRSTIANFEDFCVEFMDKFIDIIKFHNPNYNRSIILNDKYYRKSIIKNLYHHDQKLTNREIECLYWAANGKSSAETAMILKIKPATVDEYRMKIKKKLNCSNLVHAVYEAIKRGYIGAFNKIQIS
jgi:DNA-binding CsgD family transcriptional regulator